jgi:hypothetical protein
MIIYIVQNQLTHSQNENTLVRDEENIILLLGKFQITPKEKGVMKCMFWNIVGGLMPPMENLTSLLVLFKTILIWLPENKKGDFSHRFF